MFLSPTNNYQNYFSKDERRFENYGGGSSRNQGYFPQQQIPSLSNSWTSPHNNYNNSYEPYNNNFPIPPQYYPAASTTMNQMNNAYDFIPRSYDEFQSMNPRNNFPENIRNSFEGTTPRRPNFEGRPLFNNMPPEHLRVNDYLETYKSEPRGLNNSIEIPPRFFPYFEPSPERNRLGLDNHQRFGPSPFEWEPYPQNNFQFPDYSPMPLYSNSAHPQRFPEANILSNDMIPVIHYPTLPSHPIPVDKHVRFLGRYKNYDLQKKFQIKEYGKDDLKSNNVPRSGNLSQEDEVFEAIKNMIILEEHLATAKGKIQSAETFQLTNIYELFDDNSSGQIVIKEFLDGCKALGLKNVSSEDASLLMKRVSRDGNLKLSFEEFKRIFFNENIMHKTNVSRRASVSLNTQAKEIAAEILKTHLNVEVSAEEIRKGLATKGIDMKNAFTYIDNNKSGLATKKEFLTYLQSHNFTPSETSFSNFFLKMDRNASGQVNAAEFKYEMEPKSAKKK